MNFYGGCVCGNIYCNCRHSIDNVTGRPIYIEDYVIPVYKGATLEVEFQLPFDLNDAQIVEVISSTSPTLENPTVTYISDNLISLRWEASVTDGFPVGSQNKFRIKVTDTQTDEVRIYNDITIRVF